MEKLPLELITENILSGMHMMSQLQCRDVSKTWRALMPKPKIGLLYGVSHRKVPETEAKFYFAEKNNSDEVNTYKHADNDYFATLAKLNHSIIMPASVFKGFMVGSCNGLICYVGHPTPPKNPTEKYEHEIQVYICNPVTEKHFQLPAVECTCNTWVRMTLGFGYIRSSNKYKFVSILCGSSRRPEKVQVCTLRGGAGTGWRNKTITFEKEYMITLDDLLPSTGVFDGGALHWVRQPDEKQKILPAPGVFAGGALNWMCQSGKKPKILAFDLEHETFEFIRAIPFVVCDTIRVGLMELGGNLCVPEVAPGKHITIWELRYRKTIKYAQKHKADHSYWFKRFNVAWENCSCFAQVALTESEKCLLWYNVILSCYEPETNTLRKTDEILKKLKDDFTKEVFTTMRTTSYVNSLVSCS